MNHSHRQWHRNNKYRSKHVMGSFVNRGNFRTKTAILGSSLKLIRSDDVVSIDTQGVVSFDTCWFSTGVSLESDRTLFSKTCINLDLTVRWTSNGWNWKANSKFYLVSQYELNHIVGRPPSIAKPLIHLRNPAAQKATKSPKFSKM